MIWDVRVKQEDNTAEFFGLPDTARPRPGRPTTATAPALVGLIIGFCVLLVGCGNSSSDLIGGSGAGAVRVFAAASLTDAFGELETAFEAANAEYDIQLNLAGSATLRTQILGGAPVDVFASANTLIMDQVIAAQANAETAVGDTPIFATNRLLIAVPLDNEAGVAGLEDLQRAELFVGLCAEGVPCGDLAAEALDKAAITAQVDSYEPNVRSLLAKISSRELDAGLVYATDVAADPDVTGIELADDHNPQADYPITVMSETKSAEGAKAFVEFVLGADGQRILADHGFGPP